MNAKALTTVAAIQYRPPDRSPDIARAELALLIEEAITQGAEIIVAPELATTGYVWADRKEAAEFAETLEGATAEMLSDASRSSSVTIVAGLIERAEGVLYNSAAVALPDGSVRGYRKQTLFKLDETWADPGERSLRIQTPAGHAAVGICMDINSDEFTHWLELTRPDGLLFPVNWIDEAMNVVPYWLMRMGQWRGWFVAANKWGDEAHIRYRGHSAIVGPGGQLLSMAPWRGNAVITAQIPRTPGGND